MIVDEIKKHGETPLYFGDKEKLLQYLVKEKQPGDILLLMGAGDIRKTSEALRDILSGE